MDINQIRQEKLARELQFKEDRAKGRRVENMRPEMASRAKELREYHGHYDKIEDYFGLLLSEGLIDEAFFEYNLARLLDLRIFHYGSDDEQVIAHYNRLKEIQEKWA